MKQIFDKFWNDEDFALRVARGLAIAGGAYIMSGGLTGYVPESVGIGLMGIASMFSGNGRRL